jgi:cytochrome c biogenesis protein CcdA
VAVGVAMVGVAALLWRHRERLSDREPPDFDPYGRSSWILGASITAFELPTAFPYFAVIAAIVGSGLGPGRQLFLLVLFNICFVLPLLGIIAVLWIARENAGRVLGTGRDFLQRHWPELLAGLAVLAGVIVIGLGLTGLAEHGHFRKVGHRIHKLFS